MSAPTDRNLLVGVLALQRDLIDRQQFVAAMHAWMVDKTRPLDEILREQEALQEDGRALLAALVEKHVELHGTDAHKSLAALRAIGSTVREELRSIAVENADEELQETLQFLAADRDTADPNHTEKTSVGASTSSGARFRILRPHARGGLGEVSVALDSELNREVALKEIQDRYADDDNSRSRFLLEAEITGGLEHPGIVPVYGLGTYDDGRPYYAMRFIRGDSLKEAIEGFHSAPDDGKQSLSYDSIEFRKLLGRFVDVCQAVEYAHSRGVLHRDLKPGNVMLGKYGETLVVDWGLAKPAGFDTATDDGETMLKPSSGSGSAPTQLGSAIGTPAYMPPEQASGKLDELGPASDVYSLGATLYHLLTGRPPQSDQEVGAVLHKVQRGEFPRPSEVNPRIPKALAAICLKAMAAKQADRYPTPAALADEIERYLADEPVAALPDPLTVRARRWMRKHPGVTAAGAMAALLLLAFFAAGFGVVTNFNRQLEAANTAETEARGRAEENFDAARQAVEQYLVTVTDSEKLREADFTELRKELLKSAKPFYEKLRDQKPGDEQVEASRADAFLRLASIQQETGALEQARDNYRECLAVYERLADDFPGVPEYRGSLAASHNDLGRLLIERGMSEQAGQHYEQALAIAQQLTDDFPTVPVYRSSLAGSHNNLANLLHDLGKPAEAEKHFEQALAIAQQLAEELPAVPEYRSDLAASHVNLGSLLHSVGEREKARQHYEQALAIAQQLADDFPTVPEYRSSLVSSHNNLANLLQRLGKPEGVRQHYEQALAVQQQLADDFPTVPEYRSGLAANHYNLGTLLQSLGAGEETRQHYEQALAIRQQLVDDFPTVPDYRRDLAASHVNLGSLLHSVGEREKARQHYEQALTIQQRLTHDFFSVPLYRQEWANSHSNLGILLAELGDGEEARQHYEQALAIRQQLVKGFPTAPDYRSALAASHNNLGGLLADLALVQEARRHYELALAMRQKLTDDFPTVPEYRNELANSHNHLGILFHLLGEGEASRKHYEQALAIQQQLADDFSRLPRYAIRLGGNYCNYGNLVGVEEPAAALPWYDKARTVLQAVVDKQPREATARLFLRNTHASRAQALDRLARYADAAESWQRAAELDDGRSRLSFQQFAANSSQMAEQADVLEQMLAGDARPSDADQRIALAKYCYTIGKQLYLTAAVQYQQAFSEQPELVADPARTPHRYAAACCAALAAAGKGNDATNLTSEEQAVWRKQALAWLQADLKIRAANARSENARISQPARQILTHWARDPDLASVRDPAELAQLPDAERRPWDALWQTVRSAAKPGAAPQEVEDEPRDKSPEPVAAP